MATWRLFREEYETSVLSGMTVNERMFALGTTDSFDSGVANRNAEEIRRLLIQTRVDEPSIERIIEEL